MIFQRNYENSKMVCYVAINSLEITFILQPVCNDVKIDPARPHGNRPFVDESLILFLDSTERKTLIFRAGCY